MVFPAVGRKLAYSRRNDTNTQKCGMTDVVPGILKEQPHLDLPTVLLGFQIHFTLSLEFILGFDIFNKKQNNRHPPIVIPFVRFGFPKEHFFPDYKNETHKKSNNIETYILKISVIPPSRHNHCLFIFLKVFLSFEIQIILWLQFYNIPFHLKICFCYFYRIILLNLHLKNGYLEFYYIKSP